MKLNLREAGDMVISPMEPIPYKTRSGASQFRPRCTSGEVQDGTLGFCLACGAEAGEVEPDARKYKCESCGAPKVYGLEELLMMGLVELEE